MKSRTKTALRVVLASLTLFVFAVLAGLVPLPVSLFKAAIAGSVHEATGLDLELGGTFSARLGPRAGVAASQVLLLTQAGDSLLELDEAKVGFSMLALARGRIHLRQVVVDGLRVDYCRPLPDRPERSTDSVGDLPAIVVDVLEASNVEIVCDGQSADISIEHLAATAPDNGPLAAEATAVIAGNPTRVTAAGGTLTQLLGEQAFPFDAKLELEQGSLRADGVIVLDAGALEVDTRLAINIPDAHALGDAFELSVPDIGAVTFEAAVRSNATRLEIDEVESAFGETQLTASAVVDLASDSPKIDVDAFLQLLDTAPFLETAPGTSTEPADFMPLFESLQKFDAVASIRIEEVAGLPVSIRAASVEAALVGGLLDLGSANADVLGGEVTLTGRLDTLAACPTLDLAAELDSVALNALHETGWLDASIDGRIAHATVASSSCGSTVEGHLERWSGELIVTDSNLTVADGLPIDVAAINLNLKPNQPISAAASATLSGERIDVAATTASLRELRGSDPWPVSVVAKAAGSELRAEGTTRVGDGPTTFDLKANFSVPRIGALHAFAGVAPGADASLRATARLRLDASQLVADDIAVTLGGTDLSGRLSWFHAATPDTLAVTLRSEFIDLDKIVEMIEEAGSPAAKTGTDDRQVDEPPAWHGLPPVDLDLAFGAIRGGPVDVTDLSIEGHLRAGYVDNARVSALVEDDLSLRGQLDIDVRKLPATLAFDAEAENADLGRLLRRLELVEDVSMRADELELQVGATGDSMRSALANLRVDATVHRFEWDIPRKRSDADFEVRLETLAISMQPGKPLGASTSGAIDGIPVELWLESPGLGTVLGDDAELPLRVVAAAEEDIVMIDMLLDRSAEDEIRGRIEISGQALNSGDRDLAALEAPLGDYVLTGDLALGELEASVSGLEARLGSSELSGNASISGNGRQRIAIELRSPRLQASDWTYLPTFGRVDPAEASASMPKDSEEEQTESKATRKGPLLVINELIDRYQARFDLDVSVEIDELYAGRDFVGGAMVGLHIDETDFRLQPLTIRLPGGSLDAEYGWHIDDGLVDAVLKARADGLVYGGLLKLADPELDARGLLYVDVDFAAEHEMSAGRPELDLLLANADGTMDVAVWPEKFESGLLDMWTANLVFALLPSSDEGASRLNCVVARLEARDGLLKTKNVLMDSTRQIIRGRGKIDLNQGEINLLVTPQAKREKFLSASTPVRVTGPLNDFQVGVEPGGFIGTMIKWYTNLIYVPYKWLTGQRFPEDGTQTCFDVMGWELTPELEAYFRERDFSAPPRRE